MEQNSGITLHPAAQHVINELQLLLGELANNELIDELTRRSLDKYPHDSSGDIVMGWTAEDVLSVARDRHPQALVTYDDAIDALNRVADRFEANMGVSWDSLDYALMEVLSEKNRDRPEHFVELLFEVEFNDYGDDILTVKVNRTGKFRVYRAKSTETRLNRLHRLAGWFGAENCTHYATTARVGWYVADMQVAGTYKISGDQE
ncbi:MAG: hypothetical protein AAFY20_19015 [Cyanobacteria bacterium J06639_14]